MLPDLGNGLCDLKFNNKEFFFDIGDCCFEWTSKHFNGDTLKYEYTYPHCIKSNNFCIPEELGDGICQDHNNGPFCQYDLGDCCLLFHGDDCCGCACRPGLDQPLPWVSYVCYGQTCLFESELNLTNSNFDYQLFL